MKSQPKTVSIQNTIGSLTADKHYVHKSLLPTHFNNKGFILHLRNFNHSKFLHIPYFHLLAAG